MMSRKKKVLIIIQLCFAFSYLSWLVIQPYVKHLRPYTWLNSLPLPKKLRNLSDAKIARRQSRVENLFSSCKLVYEEMPEETGLVYIHLHRKPALEKNITLIDKVGFKHRVDVDNYEFVIQERAVPVKTLFSELDHTQVRERVQQLVELVLKRCEKGICDRDRSFVQNVAFCVGEERALFIDIGQFYKDPSILREDEQKKELQKRLGNLKAWTEQHFPEYVSIIDEEIKRF